ncbi:hypothetical protein LQ938_02945 [Microbacterium sp. cx-55]|uniref:hypothetical protein n=1 Tax=Microbacterium sp. cx-55 TaxID=2875948 RepID=UPI001CBF1C61|nr:hypothetical protein [Microbacterium sp. cx-55]MBZ4486846.1 hypothetical protein [Microbacterium sp. cx-55]UGB35774.1 hypothetical protein LQ938_02945 [Microbacterium sp. cx-55]
MDTLTREVLGYLAGDRSAADGARIAGVSSAVFLDVADAFLQLVASRAHTTRHRLGAAGPAQSASFVHAVTRYLSGTASLRESARRAGVPGEWVARVSSECISYMSRVSARALVNARRATASGNDA